LENYLYREGTLSPEFLKELGFSDDSANETEVRDWAKQYYDNVILYNHALDAAIQATPGLGKLVDEFTKQI
jgi:hypothetical protein